MSFRNHRHSMEYVEHLNREADKYAAFKKAHPMGKVVKHCFTCKHLKAYYCAELGKYINCCELAVKEFDLFAEPCMQSLCSSFVLADRCKQMVGGFSAEAVRREPWAFVEEDGESYVMAYKDEFDERSRGERVPSVERMGYPIAAGYSELDYRNHTGAFAKESDK